MQTDNTETNQTEETKEQTEEAPEQEQLEAAEPQGEEVEARPEDGEPEGEADDSNEDEEKKEERQAQPNGEKHKRKTGYRRVVERQERALAEKDQTIQQLSQQLAQFAQFAQQQTQQQTQTPPPQGAGQSGPDSTQQAVEQFNSLLRHGVQQVLAEREQETAARQLEQKWEQQLPADEEEAYEARRLLNRVRQSLAPGPVRDALLNSEFAPKIISTLFGNPLELARISALPEGRQAVEIGRLEERFSAGAAPTKPKSATRPQAPPTAVNGSASSTRSLQDLPISEYKRRMNKSGGR